MVCHIVDGKAVFNIHAEYFCLKELNICWHYYIEHSDRFRNLQGKATKDEVKRRLYGARGHQSVVTDTM